MEHPSVDLLEVLPLEPLEEPLEPLEELLEPSVEPQVLLVLLPMVALLDDSLVPLDQHLTEEALEPELVPLEPLVEPLVLLDLPLFMAPLLMELTLPHLSMEQPLFLPMAKLPTVFMRKFTFQ
jgi:hypothetical protein